MTFIPTEPGLVDESHWDLLFFFLKLGIVDVDEDDCFPNGDCFPIAIITRIGVTPLPASLFLE